MAELSLELSLAVFSQRHIIDAVLLHACVSSPLESWGSYGAVCRSWRESFSRVVSSNPTLFVRFSPENSSESIRFSRQGTAVVATKFGQGGYAWCATKGIPLGSLTEFACRVEHTVRVEGGGYVGCMISANGNVKKVGSSRFDMPTGSSFATLGTVSGSIDKQNSRGETESTTPRRLEAPQGTVFWMRYNVATDTLRFSMQLPGHDIEDLQPEHRILQLAHPDDDTSDMKLHWVLSLFAPRTVFTLQQL